VAPVAVIEDSREVQAMRARQSRSRRAGRRRRRDAARLIWPVLGLALVGAAAAALLASLAGRRRSPCDGERRERAADRDAGRDRAGAAPEAPSAPAIGQASEVPGTSEVTEAVEDAEPGQAWIAGPAGNLFVRDSGEVGGGPGARLPVLFVHSLAGNGGQWALQLDHLRRHRRAMAVDLRGHGDSDPADDGAYGVASLAADLAAVADHFALRRFVLAGHSLGAAVAIAYAAEHPERVAGLLLVDPNGDQTRVPREQIEPFLAALRAEPLREIAAYFRQLVAGGDRDAARWVMEDLLLTHEDAIPAAVAAAVEFAPLPALARYGGPTLAVISEMNSLPYSLHNLLPEMPVHLVRGTGHWLMMDRPELFNHVLDDFLAEVDGA
jgi:pimeloyl-ACP methyl ester carboxylesterase